MPSLQARIQDNAEELPHLVTHLAQRAVGIEAPELAEEVVQWVDRQLGRDYPWPGNIRELEQCLRNVLIRRAYTPPRESGNKPAVDAQQELLGAILGGELTADELLRRYCTLVFRATGSYEATARRLQIDRRTVRAKVDAELLGRVKTPQRSE